LIFRHTPQFIETNENCGGRLASGKAASSGGQRPFPQHVIIKEVRNMIGFTSDFENSLFDQFERMRQQIDDLFGEWPRFRRGPSLLASEGFPAVNVGSSPERVDVYLFAPGIDPKKLDISLQQTLLTVSGERTLEEPEDVSFYRQERFAGPFRKVVSLPEDVDPEQVEASYRDGVLHIRIQRRERVKARQIEVK
jgi:HSP20 family protein